MLRINKKEKGFTFLEVMVSIFVLAVGIVAAYLVSQTPIFYTQNSINRLTASFLAQEGIEIVRNIRDENWLNGRSWDIGLSGNCSSGTGQYCFADYNDSSLETSSDPSPMRVDNVFFNNDSGVETKFKRKITIDSEGIFLDVKSIVEWSHKGDSYNVVVEDKLYNWWGN